MKLSSPFLELSLSTHLSLRPAEGAGLPSLTTPFVALSFRCFRASYHTFLVSLCTRLLYLFFFFFYYYSFVSFNFSLSFFFFFFQASSHRFFSTTDIIHSFIGIHTIILYVDTLVRFRLVLVCAFSFTLVLLPLRVYALMKTDFWHLPPPRRSCFFSGD